MDAGMHVDNGMGHAHTCVPGMFAEPYWQSSIIIRTCACAKVFIRTCARTCAWTWACACVCIDQRMYVCMDTRIDIHVRRHVHGHAYMDICMGMRMAMRVEICMVDMCVDIVG